MNDLTSIKRKPIKINKMFNYKSRLLTRSKTSCAVLGKTVTPENYEIPGS